MSWIEKDWEVPFLPILQVQSYSAALAETRTGDLAFYHDN